MRGRRSSARISSNFLSEDDELSQRVHTNLAARRLRLVFVADTIQPELRRVVEFLNEQMGETEVLAVEVKQYVDESGTQQTIVPRVLGQTQAAQQAKGKRQIRHWDRASVLEEVEREHGEPMRGVIERILPWASELVQRRAWWTVLTR